MQKGRTSGPRTVGAQRRNTVSVSVGATGLGVQTPDAALLARHARPPRLRAKDIERLRQIRARWREDAWGPVRFVLDATRVTLVPDQVDGLVELGALMCGQRPGKLGVSIVSGHGCGKTVLDVMAGLWVLDAFDDSLVVTTSPKQAQLFDNLWAEAQRVIEASDLLSLLNEWTKTRIGVRGGSDGWQMVARVARKGENIAGGHAPSKLIIVDEASGVEEELFEPLIGGMSGERNVIMLTGNGTRTSGEFFRSHRAKEQRQWTTLCFNARKSPLVSAEHIARMERKYGKDSPIVRVRVDGGFPEQGERALFSVHAMDMARGRGPIPGFEQERLSIGVDVALFGKDYSAAVVRQGPNIVTGQRWHGYDSIDGASQVLMIAQQHAGLVERICVDANGWGRGLCDTLLHVQDGSLTLDSYPDAKALLSQVDIIAVMVSTSATRSDEYFSLRDELWYELANRYKMNEIGYHRSFDENEIETLEAELQVIEGGFHRGTLRHKVASKEEMAKSLHGSPDLADATCLAYYTGGHVALYL